MHEHNRLRLERLAARYEARLRAGEETDEASFDRLFVEHAERVIRPVLEACAAPLRAAGHEARVVRDEAHHKPSIELALGLRGAAAGKKNRVGFCVLRWEGWPVQLLAYLVVEEPPFDLERFAKAEELTAERLEQMVVDAIEHVIMANAP
jgi:hypothetical protein